MKTPQRGQPGNSRDNRGQSGGGGRPADGGNRSGQAGRDGGPSRPGGGSRPTDGSGSGPRRPANGGPAGSRGPRPPRQDGRSGGGPRGDRGRSNRPLLSVRGDPLFGRNAVLESLRASKRPTSHLWIAEGLRPDPRLDEIRSLAEAREILTEEVPRPMLDDITQGANHQGVLLEVGDYIYAELEDIVERDGTILVLDHLQDPQNFGTLLRAADAAGVAGVVIASDRSVSVTPAVVNASAGAVEHLNVAEVPNIGRALDKIGESGRWIVGLAGDEGSTDLFATDIPTPVALVVGAEADGISPGIRRRCQVMVSLPMLGQIESLNAATAGSIALYDILRREREEAADS